MEMVFLLIGIGLFLVLAWLRTRMTGFVAQRTEHYVQGRAGQFALRTHLNGP